MPIGFVKVEITQTVTYKYYQEVYEDQLQDFKDNCKALAVESDIESFIDTVSDRSDGDSLVFTSDVEVV